MIAKLCGMRSREAALAAEAAGAALLGFIFWEKAWRYIAPNRAAEIAEALRRAGTVGVFVDEEPEEVNRIARLVGLSYVQLHGMEDAAYARKIERPIIKAYRYGDTFSAEAANAYPAELILVDAYKEGSPGGTGEAFDWERAAAEVARVEKPVLIAGGIGAGNVRRAVEVFHPYGVDVSGSLEENGEKSLPRIEAFMEAFREAAEGERGHA